MAASFYLRMSSWLELHYFASKMSAMNVPEEDIMRFGL